MIRTSTAGTLEAGQAAIACLEQALRLLDQSGHNPIHGARCQQLIDDLLEEYGEDAAAAPVAHPVSFSAH